MSLQSPYREPRQIARSVARDTRRRDALLLAFAAALAGGVITFAVEHVPDALADVQAMPPFDSPPSSTPAPRVPRRAVILQPKPDDDYCSRPFRSTADGVTRWDRCYVQPWLARGNATVTVRCTPKCMSILNDMQLLGSAEVYDAPLLAGDHVITVRWQSGERRRMRLSLPPGDRREVTFSLADAKAAATGEMTPSRLGE